MSMLKNLNCISVLPILMASLLFSLRIHAADAPDFALVTQETTIGSAEIQFIPATLKASLDGKHIAFVAQHDNSWLVVVDGVLGREYDGIGDNSLVFSPDSKRLAYAAKKDNDWLLVVDGVEDAACDGVRDVFFSPNSKRVAYAANHGNTWSVVVDGAGGKKYDECRDIVFSPDSRRVAYAANRGRNWIAVIDGAESQEHNFICGISFSPDCRRVAYIAQHGNNWSVVVDGVEAREYDAVGGSGFINPESRRKAYAALNADPQGVIADDIIGESGPVFSPDNKRIAYWARRGHNWLIIVDGVESKPYDDFIRGSNIVFDTPTRLHTIAVQGKDAIRVTLDIVEKK